MRTFKALPIDKVNSLGLIRPELFRLQCPTAHRNGAAQNLSPRIFPARNCAAVQNSHSTQPRQPRQPTIDESHSKTSSLETPYDCCPSSSDPLGADSHETDCLPLIRVARVIGQFTLPFAASSRFAPSHVAMQNAVMVHLLILNHR